MWDLLGVLKEKLLGKRGICIDNEAFRLHYRYTLMILAAFALIISSKQYLGDPIECFSYGKDIPADALNLYCWIQTTFILPSALNKKVGVDVVAPGIDTRKPGEDVVYLKYYQWVGLFLIFQGVMFYITRFLWKALEGGKVEGLVLDFQKPILKDDVKKVEALQKNVAEYMTRSQKQYKWVFYKYFGCEILNFLNVLFQMYLLNHFLDGEFTTFGPDVVTFVNQNQEDRVDPMIKVFPRITKCTFHRFGPTGNIQTHDAFCVLPLNILNEKVFVFLWFWFVLLALISGLVVLYRILLILSSSLRRVIFRKTVPQNKYDIEMFCQDIGFWYLMKMFSRNVDAMHYEKVVQYLQSASNAPLNSPSSEKGSNDASSSNV